MKKDFFSTKLAEDVLATFSSFSPINQEVVTLEEGLNRVLAKDFYAPEDLPGFCRSTMDGYAVKAEDTFGASEAVPVWLTVVGEIKMGEVPSFTLKRGETVRIFTGGMLPEGANAVVMVEHTQLLDGTTVEVFKPVAPLQNVILADEDFAKDSLVLPKGHRLRPQDLGVLAAFGQQKIKVYKRPLVAIISTGDEVISIQENPRPGQVRDVNSYTLSALVEEAGGIPLRMGIVRDDPKALRSVCQEAIARADVVLISGGSSVGMRDFTLDIIKSFPESEILCHGIAISPGKPTIFARVGEKAIWGLPGQVASAIIVFFVFVRRFIQWIGGERHFPLKAFKTIKARMKTNVPSVQGREDYLRVRIMQEDNTFWAEPILGKSGLINTLVKADGLVKIDWSSEGLDKGEEVEVILF